ncbi:histidine phosphatase family protein [Patescibacteria group bacterium]|nr:histidine phosphatase family protein [Patescibacteria group bacterium]
MNIYFVRHGSTEGNETDQFQLPTIELSERGLKQAEVLANRFKSIPIDIIFSSPMMRASQTAQAISLVTGHAVNENPIFEEVNRPTAVRGRCKSEPEVKEIMKIVKSTFTDPDNRHSDEEDYFQIRDRAQKMLEFLSKKEERNILVVTHGEILKMVLALVIFGDKITPELFYEVKRTFVPDNTGITTIQYDLSFELHESGWYVLGWNDHAHFGEF